MDRQLTHHAARRHVGSSARSIARVVRRVVRRSRRVGPQVVREGLTTAHAVAVLVAVEAVIRWVPLPRLGSALGCRIDLSPRTTIGPVWSPSELERGVRRRLRCAHRVTGAWPLSRGPCLRRALVGGHLVRRLDPAIRLGTFVEGGEVVAHAWLELDGRPVEDIAEYVVFETPLSDGERHR